MISLRPVQVSPTQALASRVLVVDDVPDIRHLLHDVLSDEHLMVETAENGMQAIAVLGAFRPHLVLLDARMPTLDGFAGLAWIHGPLEGDWCVEIAGDAVPAQVSLDPFYDPRGERLRA